MLHIEGLVKTYQAAAGALPVPVLDMDSFYMGEQEQVALIGPSGSGKSTLLNIIAGIVRPTAGTITFRGHHIERLTEPQLDRFRAQHIGYVFQSYNLLPGFTALENVLVAMRFSMMAASSAEQKQRAAELLSQVGLEHRLQHKPSQLSGGEQQRVSIARALANRPALVLADEPTASLDSANAEKVFRLLGDACRANGAALLLCSHDVELVRQLGRVVPLRELTAAAFAVTAGVGVGGGVGVGAGASRSSVSDSREVG
ncbi:ABC transporter ATP-binding protein [Paenibacillus koleovorans]|uniref:ABC transporter ATP-binding protein n=1 Tax=Paenibacillus koleovorans TaxID=121608 RepID=UPI000FD85158|nr:ABC transporter ATP-binding protein [Paenibacillus koleovorans]